jgi:hypothetical protein
MLERVYKIDGAPFPVRWFAPRPCEQDYCCDFEIAWPQGAATRSAFGIDPVQALQLAMFMVGAELVHGQPIPGRVTWLESEDLGLPVSTSTAPPPE